MNRGTLLLTWASAALLTIAADARDAQSPKRDGAAPLGGSATIGGAVTAAGETPTPIRRALVTLSSGMAGQVQVTTDDRGRFVFESLPAGRYTLTAEKPAYVKTFYGSRRAGHGPASPIAISDGQRITDISMRLMRGAVIAGSIVDEQNQPVAGAQVRVYQPRIVNGERRFVEPPGPIDWATSDDRGRYRIYGLVPGEYAVRSTGGGGVALDVRLMTPAELEIADRALRTAPDPKAAGSEPDPPRVTRAGMYYPGVIDVSQAQTITVEAGEERTGVDIRSVLVRSSRVEGVMVGPDGQPVFKTLVGLANVSAASLWSSPGSIRTGPDGRWVIPSIAPGRYMFFGTGAEGSGPITLWTQLEIEVGESDVTGAVLQFLPGVSVTGRIVTGAGSTSRLDPTALRVSLTAVTAISGAALALPRATPAADGSFALDVVPPGRYRVAVTGASSWFLHSAVTSGRDVLDGTLEIRQGQNIEGLVLTLSDRPAVISGTMFDRLGRPTPEYSIVVFSTDRSHWTSSPRRISGAVKLGSDGRFSVSGLPAGEYYMAALVDPDPASLTDPAFLEQLAAGAIRVSLAEGERKVQDVRIGG